MIQEIDFPEAFSPEVEFYREIQAPETDVYIAAATLAGIKLEYWKCAKDRVEIRVQKGADLTDFLNRLQEASE